MPRSSPLASQKSSSDCRFPTLTPTTPAAPPERPFDAWNHTPEGVEPAGSFASLDEATAAGVVVTIARCALVYVAPDLADDARRRIVAAVFGDVESVFYRALASARSGREIALACFTHRRDIGRTGRLGRVVAEMAWSRAVYRAREVAGWTPRELALEVADVATNPLTVAP